MRLILATTAACLTGALASHAAETVRLPLQTHAHFFSAETKQAKPVDPQVFVADAAAPEGVGPQGIRHVAGVRPAFIEADAPSTPLLNAEKAPLGFTLQEWLAAKGDVAMTPSGAGEAAS